MTSAQTIRLDQLDARIRSVWSRSQTLHLVAGLLALLYCVIPLFLIGMLIDWLTYMPSLGRFAILLILLAVSLHRAWQCGWRHLRLFDARRTALQLESHHGGLSSLLISAIQFREQDGGGSDALRERTCSLAEEAAMGLQPEKAVPYSTLRRPGALALVCSGVIVAFALINAPFLGVGALRIFLPWTTVEYPTNTQIQLDQDLLVIKEGDSAQIMARLEGVLPENAYIYVRTGDSRARKIDLEVVGDNCTYTIASASRDFTYRIKAGDDRTAWHEVKVIPAPKVERVAVGMTFPGYLDRKPETIEALTLTVPEGTKVDWDVKLDRAISAATFLRDGEEPVPLKVSSDGRSVAFDQSVTASTGYSFSWVEKDNGFTFTSPRYYLQVASDQAPRVELTSPETNLVAMVGRPVSLAVRVQDDHGIGASKIVYRVNQRDEALVDLDLPSGSAGGEQPLDWDYREAIADLKIGDTVSFALQVSDRYPGPEGAHVVRTDARRITFLSKEDYLEYIQKKIDRLLSRVQTMYRQQRAAFEVVSALDTTEEAYLQTCQIEAIRQELVRDQLKEVAVQVQNLLDDLAANNVSDAIEGESIGHVRTALLEIADTHIATAAARLRSQSGATGSDTSKPDPAPAARAVNTAARELGSLVLLRSIDTAQEVYAREARMLAQVQADLRWRAVQSPAGEEATRLADEQKEVAQWTGRLINDLQQGMRYEKRPLAVLRLIRSVKELRRSGSETQMLEAATLIGQGSFDKAANLQAGLVRTLLDAEFSVRISGAYTTLIKTRDQIRQAVVAQAALGAACDSLEGEAFQSAKDQIATTQAALRKQLLTTLLPTVPAPRAELFDELPPKAPPADALLQKADRAMAEALLQLAAGDQNATSTQQGEAQKALTELSLLVDKWALDLGLETLGLSALVAVTGERLARIEEYEARVIGLLEKTDIAAAEDQKVSGIAEAQLLLTEELAAFISDLDKQNDAQPDKDIPPLVSRLRWAERAMRDAVTALQKDQADDAIGAQDLAADTLAQSHAIVVAQNERLAYLQGLLMFQRSVKFASGYMADIVAEQRDMIEVTEAVESGDVAKLMPVFGNLRRCLEDVAPLLDLIAARIDAGTPLAFAATDLEDAMISLQAGDKLDAIDAQDVAAESLEQVQKLVEAIQEQTGYVAEMVQFLHLSVADASMLEYQQAELRDALLAGEQADLKPFIQTQQALLAKANEQGKQLFAAAGNPELIPPADPLVDSAAPAKPEPVFKEPAKQMQLALAALQSGDAEAAAEQMSLAVASFQTNAASLLAVLEVLHGLPSIEITSLSEPALVRLVDVLAVGSAHKVLLRETHAAESKSLQPIAEQQGPLAARCKELAAAGEPNPLLTAASGHLTAAAAALQSTDRNSIKLSQKAADEKLRHFVIEQALILDTSIPPPSVSDADAADGEGSDSEAEFSAGFISDFVSGEGPKDKEVGWKVFADRNRAALNQNFARELPLEYRGLLKNYYERVAE